MMEQFEIPHLLLLKVYFENKIHNKKSRR